MRLRLPAALLLALLPSMAQAQTTAVRPAQIVGGTPDITVTVPAGSNNVVISSTVPWRTDTTTTPSICTAVGTPVGCAQSDNASILELTNAGAITLAIPDATGSTGAFPDGTGFTVQVGAGTVTLNRTTSSTINGKTSITLGPYQSVTLTSRTSNWYGALTVPQPAAGGTGTTSLRDNMTWATAGGGTAPTNTAAPTLTPTAPAVYGVALTCGNGTWSATNPPTSYSYQIFRDGTSIATTAGYTTVAADAGHLITCVTTGINAGGSTPSPASTAVEIATCSQSQAFLARAGALNTTHLGGYDTLICGLNTDGVWATLDLLYVLATDTSANAALNLVASTNTLTVVGSPTFTANQGYAGVNVDPTTNYLNTGFALSTATHWATASAHLSVWVLSGAQSTSGIGCSLGSYDGTGYNTINPWHATQNVLGAVNNNGSASFNSSAAPPSVVGHYVGNRSGTGSAVQLYRNGASLSLAGTGTYVSTVVAPPVYILGYNNNNTGGGCGTADVISAVSVGSSLTAAQVANTPTNTTGLYSRLCAYLTTVGARSGAC